MPLPLEIVFDLSGPIDSFDRSKVDELVNRIEAETFTGVRGVFPDRDNYKVKVPLSVTELDQRTIENIENEVERAVSSSSGVSVTGWTISPKGGMLARQAIKEANERTGFNML